MVDYALPRISGYPGNVQVHRTINVNANRLIKQSIMASYEIAERKR